MPEVPHPADLRAVQVILLAVLFLERTKPMGKPRRDTALARNRAPQRDADAEDAAPRLSGSPETRRRMAEIADTLKRGEERTDFTGEDSEFGEQGRKTTTGRVARRTITAAELREYHYAYQRGIRIASRAARKVQRLKAELAQAERVSKAAQDNARERERVYYEMDDVYETETGETQ